MFGLNWNKVIVELSNLRLYVIDFFLIQEEFGKISSAVTVLMFNKKHRAGPSTW